MAATELKDLHLADLHERAAARGVSGYRLMRREELIEALSAAPEARPDAEADAESEAKPRRRRRGRRSKPEPEPEPDTDELVVVEATVLDDSEDEPVELGPLGAEEGDERGDPLPTEGVRGVLELTRQRYGFLRLNGLAPSDGDVYISAAQVRRCELRPGDEVAGPAREPRRGERHRALVHVDTVNGEEPQTEARPEFDQLPAVLPERRIALDSFADDVLARAVDLLAPLAYGQRILVRAAARSGRTTLLRSLARAAAADDTAKVIVLLVDERPEEATAWREALPVAEFAIATAELAPIEQVRTADLALERGRRLAETGTDAVLVCDSLSRLATAAGDVSEVKRLFGSGRKLAGGGSLTVIATVLADGRDEGEAEHAVITTESSLIVLDPELASAGVVPALRPGECRVSNEDQIREADELEAVRKLRSLLADLDPREAAGLLRERIEGTASNAELLQSL
jgi:transcription termination factor Rho